MQSRSETRPFVNTATRRLLVGVIAALGAIGSQAATPLTMKLDMQAKKGFFTERCFTLEAGQQLAYQLKTQHPIDFNLHHHEPGGRTVFPDKLVVKSQHSKQLVSESGGAYCFMATNPSDQPGAFSVVIKYEITAR